MTAILLLLVLLQQSGTSIVLDGRFDDWDGAPVTVAAPSSPDETGGGVVLTALRVGHDERHLYLGLETAHAFCLQSFEGSVTMILDVDGDAGTGVEESRLPGADLLVIFSTARSDGSRAGVAARTLVRDADGRRVQEAVSPYALGVQMAPTHASRRFEVALDRGADVAGLPALLRGAHVELVLVIRDDDDRTVDHVVLQHPLDPERVRPAGAAPVPLLRAPGTALRVVSWNVLRGKLLDDPAPFARVLSALDPDVLLLQELRSTQTAADVTAWLGEHLASGEGAGEDASRWSVVFGEVGRGDAGLLGAVASRLPASPAGVTLGSSPPWSSTRAGRVLPGRLLAAQIVDVGDRRVLFQSVHLPSGGRLDDARDVARRTVARWLVERLGPARETLGVDAVVVGGDFNLVGGTEPLQILATGMAAGGADLAVARPRQPGGRLLATWADPAAPFVPGRLDYVLHDPVLVALGGVVLDTALLPPEVLDRHGLRATDTAVASDHLPLVVDLAWRDRGGAAAGER